MEYQALVKCSSKKKDVQFKTYTVPKLKNYECLLKVNAIGICGSDLHMYDGHGGYDWVHYPLVLGHEVTGKVIDMGAEVDQTLINKRVVINPYKSCGVCDFCKRGETNCCDFNDYKFIKTPTEALRYGFREAGGMAEYMVVDSKNIITIDDAVSDEVAAISEALAVSYTAVLKIHEYKKKSILVIGPGPIGLGVAAILVGAGNKETHMLGVPQDENRLRLAKDIGVQATFTSSKDLIHKEFSGYDAIIDCSGHPSIPNEAISLLKRGGQLVLVGINSAEFSVPMDQIVRGEIMIKGSYGITQANYEAVLQMAANTNYPFRQLVAQTVPFSESLQGFESALNKVSGKVVIDLKGEM
ncbi:zinc-dependent alcohol dehydrogenase [Lysinibacillus sp. NPDC096212]|uniref:zinc-dependent alcohol dehydrogenase n=1 Tax=unclassified Lysinibacillus TaxID=2636778 RepID=UPI00380B88C8